MNGEKTRRVGEKANSPHGNGSGECSDLDEMDISTLEVKEVEKEKRESDLPWERNRCSCQKEDALNSPRSQFVRWSGWCIRPEW